MWKRPRRGVRGRLWLEGWSTPCGPLLSCRPGDTGCAGALESTLTRTLLVGGGAVLLRIGARNPHAHRAVTGGFFSAASSNSAMPHQDSFRRFNFSVHSYPARRMPMPGSAWGRGTRPASPTLAV